MTLDYISGFFDADGSITLSKSYKDSKFKSLKIDLSNCDLQLLKEIQKYLFDNFNIKGYITTKQKQKENHSIAYCLSYANNYCLELSKLLNSRHSKKRHRLYCINTYYKQVTVRNGKYTNAQISKKLAFERMFFWSLFS